MLNSTSSAYVFLSLLEKVKSWWIFFLPLRKYLDVSVHSESEL